MQYEFGHLPRKVQYQLNLNEWGLWDEQKKGEFQKKLVELGF